MGNCSCCDGDCEFVFDDFGVFIPNTPKDITYNLIIFEYFGDRESLERGKNFKHYGHGEAYKFYGKVLELTEIIAKGNSYAEVMNDAKQKIYYIIKEKQKYSEPIHESDTKKPVIHAQIEISWDGEITTIKDPVIHI